MVKLLLNDDTEYEEIEQAILGRNVVTYVAAAEAFYIVENKDLLTAPVQKIATKMMLWFKKMMEGGETEGIKLEGVVMGNLRAHMVPELKNYLDLSKPDTQPEFNALVEHWVISKLYRRTIFNNKPMGGYKYNSQDSDSSRTAYNSSSSYGETYRKPMSCFSCGKLGHIAKDCRYKPLAIQKQESTNTIPTEMKLIVCFTCRDVGHKSSQCPKRNKVKSGK